jgi:hypothetical protein
VSSQPFVLGARADIIFHHDRPVAPAPCPRSQERDHPKTGGVCAITYLWVLSLAVTEVLAGCCRLTAMWEHGTYLTGAETEALGLPLRQVPPSRFAIRHVFQSPKRADVKPAWPHDSIQARVPSKIAE